MTGSFEPANLPPSLPQSSPTSVSQESDEQRIADLECALQQQQIKIQQQAAQLQKLTKINHALIERVEAGHAATHSGPQAPYAAFQHAAVLAEQVRDRTAELSRAYDDLRRSMLYSESLQQSERWIRTITDHVPAMIAYLSAAGIYLFTNRGYDDFYGVAPGSLLHQSLDAAHGPTGAARLQPYVAQALSGDTAIFEIDEQNAAGELRHLLKTYVPHRDESQQICGFFVLNRDITDRKRTSEALRQANLHLEQRVAQRTEALQTLNQQLRQATVQAQQANQSKSQFLAAVSHDVLQPLNAARLFNGALLEHPLSEQTLPLAHAAGRALDDVGDLLRTLVDLSKLEAGQLQPELTVVDVALLLQDLASEYTHLAQTKNIRFRFVPVTARVQTDAAWLVRILRNLLTNALRYTQQGGTVLFGCRRRGSLLEIQVLDTGVGIAETDLTVIFQQFQRLPQTIPTEAGLGLGLSIVERLCHLLQHPLFVRSEPGRGSVFALKLPLSASQLPATMPVIANDDSRSAQVWVIDNDVTICQAMATLLTSWGYRVHTGGTAQAFVEAPPPDLLIVDYHLADGLTGTELLESWRAQGLLVGVPVLMITANSQQDLAQALQKQGLQLLYKPVRPMQLKSMLRFLLAERPATEMASTKAPANKV
ncbi:MAG: PAS domain-containing hybrid sensor histidine kinase/response regulator [Gammaproteobacteria bacterium]|nr:PAS domain-containing hybrid sensor histidine kinase/response regulator [Gammaproteobacteria bacterium]